MTEQTDVHSKCFNQLHDLVACRRRWIRSAEQDYNTSRKLEQLCGGDGAESEVDIERAQESLLYMLTVYAHAIFEGMVRKYALAVQEDRIPALERQWDEQLQCDLLAPESQYKQDLILKKVGDWAREAIKEYDFTNGQTTSSESIDVVQRITSLTSGYPEWRRLAELNLIRNLIVHNGGRMSSSVYRRVKICKPEQPIPWTENHWVTAVHCLVNLNNYLALNAHPID